MTLSFEHYWYARKTLADEAREPMYVTPEEMRDLRDGLLALERDQDERRRLAGMSITPGATWVYHLGATEVVVDTAKRGEQLSRWPGLKPEPERADRASMTLEPWRIVHTVGQPPQVLVNLTWRDLADLRLALTYACGYEGVHVAEQERFQALEAKLGEMHQALPTPLDALLKP